ncbi:hypothetical protein HYT55_02765 [Candidatus Woesearchaeota archaeon]|nr:hypothetical protein [Candidatus Woesearchaeota archaeon]
MLERITHSLLGRAMLTGLAAAVVACSPGRLSDADSDANVRARGDDAHTVYSGRVNILRDVNSIGGKEGDSEGEREGNEGIDTTRTSPSAEERANYREEAVLKEKVELEVQCDETSPCYCDSLRTIRGTVAYARPVVSDYTIAFVQGNDDVALLDIPSEEIVPLASWKGKELFLSGHYLSGVVNKEMSESECQLVNLVSGEILYEGICPKDIDQTFYVSQDGEELVVGNSFFAEELAWLNSSVSVAHPRFNYKMETVTFAGETGDGKEESIYLWKFVDELFFPLPKPDGARDSHPLLKDGSLLFTRDEGQGVIRLMRYDYEWDDIFEEFWGSESYTKRAAFNGTTLVSVVAGNLLEGYNIKTGEKGVFDIGVDGTVPGLDAMYVAWAKGGMLVYCELKDGWKGKEDF